MSKWPSGACSQPSMQGGQALHGEPDGLSPTSNFHWYSWRQTPTGPAPATGSINVAWQLLDVHPGVRQSTALVHNTKMSCC